MWLISVWSTEHHICFKQSERPTAALVVYLFLLLIIDTDYFHNYLYTHTHLTSSSNKAKLHIRAIDCAEKMCNRRRIFINIDCGCLMKFACQWKLSRQFILYSLDLSLESIEESVNYFWKWYQIHDATPEFHAVVKPYRNISHSAILDNRS